MKKLIRKTFVLSIFVLSAAVGSAAHAVPIVNGIFSLVNDGNTGRYAAGELIATGSFTTADAVTTTLSGFDAAPLIELFVTDESHDMGFGDISYTAATASDFIVTSPLYALFDQPTGDFVGLHGTLLNFTSSPALLLTLNGVNANFGGATFSFANLSTSNAESGYQVPEPNLLALLGIGLFALGIIRRKASSV